MPAKEAASALPSLAGHIPQGNLEMLRGHPATFTRQPGRSPRTGWRDHRIPSSAVLTGTARGRWRGGPARMDCRPPQPCSHNPHDDPRRHGPPYPFRDRLAQKAHLIRSLEEFLQRHSLCSVASLVAPTVATAPRLEMCVNTTLRLGRSFSFACRIRGVIPGRSAAEGKGIHSAACVSGSPSLAPLAGDDTTSSKAPTTPAPAARGVRAASTR
jgi:hypothetical protein